VEPWLAAALLAPQLLILLFFFFIPSYKALSLAFVQVDPFGGLMIFVGLDNFTQLFNSEEYRESAVFTVFFTVITTVAHAAHRRHPGFRHRFRDPRPRLYKSVILLPYAIAPVIAGVLWAFLFNPIVGPIADLLQTLGIPWDPNRRPGDAQILLMIAALEAHLLQLHLPGRRAARGAALAARGGDAR
jgi:sn-glycerol 3-phosphate transport system permease protein